MKQQIDKTLVEEQSKLNALLKGMTPFKQYISKQVPMLENLISFYKSANDITKKKILACIFSEKLILEKGRVANTPYSKGVLVMFKIVNALQGSEKKKDVISDVLSTNAPLIDESCNRFFDF